MKRLITQFTRLWRVEDAKRDLMALVLFSFVSMCYGNGYIHIWKADGTGDVGNYLISYNGATGTASFNMQANVKYGITLWDFPKGDINSTPKNEYGFSNSTVGSGSKYKLGGTGPGSGYGSGYIESPIGGTCNFKVEWDGSTPYLTVSYKVKDKLRYKLTGTDIYAYADLTYDNKIGITNINLYDDNTYEFQISDGSGNWYGNSETITGDWQKPFYPNTSACKIQTSSQGSNPYSYSRVYTFQTDWTSGDLNVSVTYQPISEYYLIVPAANVGNTPRAISGGWVPEGHKAFKMVGGRERNKEIVNPGLATVTLKIDGNKGRQLRYDSKDQIKFYIYDKTKNKYYQPGDNDYQNAKNEKDKASGDNTRFEYVDGTNVELIPRYRTSNGRDAIGRSHDDIKDSKQDTYYYIKKGSAKYNLDGVDYPTMSLTFMFTQYNAEKNYYNKDQTLDGHYQHGNCIYYVDENGNRVRGNAKLLVAFLKTRAYNPGANTCAKYYTEHITKAGSNTSAGVYLVGDMGGDGYRSGANTTNPTGEVNGEKYYDKNKYRMTPNYWYNGVIDNSRTDIANADSIVYSCEIKKGDATWDNFFLSFTTGDVLGTSDMWKPLLRPRVQNKMDAQALEGGVFYYLSDPKDGNDADQAQALNPLLTEAQKARYGSYRVYFNATYSTYRIAFSEKFCIGGPAVNDIEGENVNEHITFSEDYRHGLDFVPATDEMPAHYVYPNRKFTQGSTFAFFGDVASAQYNYSEDADAVSGPITKEWETQVPEAGTDYAFYNRVNWTNNGGSDGQSLGGERKGILWTLPTGYYTLRFYNHEDNLGGTDKNQHAFYTIDKKVELVNATSTYVNTSGEDVEENLGGLRTFSDDCALMLPAGVQAYYVPEIKDGRAVLKEVTDRMIPAHCPVLIYDRTQIEGRKTIRLSPSPIGHTDTYSAYTKKLADTEKNLLVDCYKESKVLQPTEVVDGTTKYNYYMTNKYYYTDDLNDREYRAVPLNFWRTRPNSTAKKNYTYLSVDQNIFPVSYTGDKNYEYETNPVNIINNVRSYCFILSIGNIDDNNVVTGITSIDKENSKAENNVWYTIQGIKVASPLMPGLYIHNGKKVIIK